MYHIHDICKVTMVTVNILFLSVSEGCLSHWQLYSISWFYETQVSYIQMKNAMEKFNFFFFQKALLFLSITSILLKIKWPWIHAAKSKFFFIIQLILYCLCFMFDHLLKVCFWPYVCDKITMHYVQSVASICHICQVLSKWWMYDTIHK